ncbi:hypothetical protein Tco_1265105 [Tanacetum coccineum]
MQDMVLWVFSQVLHFLGLMVMYSSLDLIEYRMTLNSSDLHNLSGFLTSQLVGTGGVQPERLAQDSGFELIAYSDADLAGCLDDYNSPSGGLQLLGDKLHDERGTIELYFVGTEYQLADLFTKALSREKLEYLVNRIVFHMAQQIIPAAQLVPKFQGIGRCNNYVCSYNSSGKQSIVQLPVETPDNPFVAPVNIEDIRATDDYKEYDTVFVNVVVLMNQPQLVVSTQGTHRSTPRAYRTPTLTAASPQRKKRKQSVVETSSPRKSLKVAI